MSAIPTLQGALGLLVRAVGMAIEEEAAAIAAGATPRRSLGLLTAAFARLEAALDHDAARKKRKGIAPTKAAKNIPQIIPGAGAVRLDGGRTPGSDKAEG